MLEEDLYRIEKKVDEVQSLLERFIDAMGYEIEYDSRWGSKTISGIKKKES